MEKMGRLKGGRIKMFENKTEQQAREDILRLVEEYCDTFHNKKEYHEGDRIPYASRVYDHEEMCNLVDSSLEFWLTSGRYTEQFESEFAKYLGIKQGLLLICLHLWHLHLHSLRSEGLTEEMR